MDATRYSRQIYTMGLAAQTILDDASTQVVICASIDNGLVSELVKNLSLSGVRNVKIISHDETDSGLGLALDDLHPLLDAISLPSLNPDCNISILPSLPSIHPTMNTVVLSVDHFTSAAAKINEFCRSRDLKCVTVRSAGLFGYIFTDAGSNHTITDPDGSSLSLSQSAPVSIEVPIYDEGTFLYNISLSAEHEKNHELSLEDELDIGVVAKTFTPRKFAIRSNSKSSSKSKSNPRNYLKLRRPVKVQSNVPFTVSSATDPKLFREGDIAKTSVSRTRTILSCFNGDTNTNTNTNSSPIATAFAKTCRAKFPPLQVLLGGLAAQETIKLLTGMYQPLNQGAVYDFAELFDEQHSESGDGGDRIGRGAGAALEHILGTRRARKLRSKKIFVVGTGAIGCELLKNLASLG